MERANQLSGSDWLRNSFSIWRNFSRDRDADGHPAPFPISLVSQLLDCYVANPDGVVLDPFAGSGSTLLAALHRGMPAVGLDINPEYRRIFINRQTPFNGLDTHWKYEIHDARSLADVVQHNSVEICVTSPPYWDILNRNRSADGRTSRPYSDSRQDIGNIDEYTEFLSALGQVVCQVEMVLRSGGYFILNVMDLRKGSMFYPLHADTIRTIQSLTSFSLEDIIIWDRQSDYNSMRPLGYPSKFIINKVHEYLLIFRSKGASHARRR